MYTIVVCLLKQKEKDMKFTIEHSPAEVLDNGVRFSEASTLVHCDSTPTLEEQEILFALGADVIAF